MKQLSAFCESERVWLQRAIERLAALESPTLDAPAADACGTALAAELAAIGGRVRTVPVPGGASHVIAEFGDGGRPILLLGHFDTVWPVGTLATMPIVERDGCLFGPGVLDMKSGIAIGMLALRALASASAAPMPDVVFLLTADEETGSQTSRALVEEEARRSEAVLVLEPALPDGSLKTARKGCGQFEITVGGVAAHAGIAPERGANAILELCDQILAVERLQDAHRGTSLTASLVSGGTRSNVVPARAVATIDARAWSAAETERVTTALFSLRAGRSGTTVEVSGGIERPPLERSPSVAWLYDLAQTVGRQVGTEVSEGATGGGSDGNFTAALGVPTLDGLGGIGDGAHAVHEHVVLDQLAPRAALVAGLIQTVWLERPRAAAEMPRRGR
jgi:glutamate carboxypeptidase